MGILRAKNGLAFELVPSKNQDISWIDKLLAKN
jgi:hypothetical protein